MLQAVGIPYCQSTWMSVCVLASLRLNISDTIREIAGCFLVGAQRKVESNGMVSWPYNYLLFIFSLYFVSLNICCCCGGF